ncbi:hypothetical protein [Lactococcus taiwanensis]|uniref:hypothetical protein n=1 Tax=Lactococcus taiwanensis TaxID=1151742 RepID=UPI0035170A2C
MRKMEDEEFILRLTLIIEQLDIVYNKLEVDDFWVADEINEALDYIQKAKEKLESLKGIYL